MVKMREEHELIDLIFESIDLFFIFYVALQSTSIAQK